MQLEFWARKICYWLFLWEYVSSTMSGNRNRTLLTIINCHLLYYLAQITSNKYLLKLYYIIHWKPRGWDKYLIFSHSIPILLPPLLLSHHVSTLPPSYVLSVYFFLTRAFFCSSSSFYSPKLRFLLPQLNRTIIYYLDFSKLLWSENSAQVKSQGNRVPPHEFSVYHRSQSWTAHCPVPHLFCPVS